MTALSASAQVVLFEFTDFNYSPSSINEHLTSTSYSMESSATYAWGIDRTGGNPGHVFHGRANYGTDSLFHFSVQIEAGYELTIDSVTFDSRRGGDNAWTKYDVQVSNNGTDFTSIGSGNLQGTTFETIVADNNAVPVANQTGSVDFRIYGLDGIDATYWYQDNLAIHGSVSPVPEPQAWAALAGFGLLAFALYRGRPIHWRGGLRQLRQTDQGDHPRRRAQYRFPGLFRLHAPDQS